MDGPADRVVPGRRLAAWGVHLFTASGALWGFIALGAISLRDWRTALAMMALAMAVDSIDGMLARAVGVDAAIPEFDGPLLDNVVDYLNYVVVPAFFVWRSSLLPAGTQLAVAALLLLVSAYQFCQRDAKTDDHFFKGFPSFWNVAVFYLFILRLGPTWNMAILSLLAIGVFVPIKWAYPSRMARLRLPTLALTVLWGASVVGILARLPDPPAWLVGGSLAYLAYYAGVSGYLALGRRSAPAARAGSAAP